MGECKDIVKTWNTFEFAWFYRIIHAGNKENEMTNFYLVTMKFDYYTIESIVPGRTSQAAMNKAKRIWPMREILSARLI